MSLGEGKKKMSSPDTVSVGILIMDFPDTRPVRDKLRWHSGYSVHGTFLQRPEQTKTSGLNFYWPRCLAKKRCEQIVSYHVYKDLWIVCKTRKPSLQRKGFKKSSVLLLFSLRETRCVVVHIIKCLIIQREGAFMNYKCCEVILNLWVGYMFHIVNFWLFVKNCAFPYSKMSKTRT